MLEIRARQLSRTPGNLAASWPSPLRGKQGRKGKNFQNDGNFLPSSSGSSSPQRATSPLEAQAKAGASDLGGADRRTELGTSAGTPRRGQSAPAQPGTRPTPRLISSGWRLRQRGGDSPRPSRSEIPARALHLARGPRAMLVTGDSPVAGALFLSAAFAPPPPPPNPALPGPTQPRLRSLLGGLGLSRAPPPSALPAKVTSAKC